MTLINRKALVAFALVAALSQAKAENAPNAVRFAFDAGNWQTVVDLANHDDVGADALLLGVYAANSLGKSGQAQSLVNRGLAKFPSDQRFAVDAAILVANTGNPRKGVEVLEHFFSNRPDIALAFSTMRDLQVRWVKGAYQTVNGASVDAQPPLPLLLPLTSPAPVAVPQSVKTAATSGNERVPAPPPIAAPVAISSAGAAATTAVIPPSGLTTSTAPQAENTPTTPQPTPAPNDVSAPSSPGETASASELTAPSRQALPQVLAATDAAQAISPPTPPQAVNTPTTTPKVETAASIAETYATPPSTAAEPPSSAERQIPPAPEAMQATAAILTKPEMTPEAAPSSPAASQATADEKQIRQRLADWAHAWELSDSNAYISYYAPEFSQYNNETHSAWVARRQLALRQAESVSISQQDVSISLAGDTAQATFRQVYRSGVNSDTTRQRLIWQRRDGQWLISEETVLP